MFQYGLSFDEYRRLPQMNASTLLEGAKSMAHLKLALSRGFTDSPAKQLGRAIHTALLEPDRMLVDWVVSTPCINTVQKGPNAGKECGLPGKYELYGNWFCGKHKGDAELRTNVLTNDDLLTIHNAVAAVNDNKEVRDLFLANSGCEVTAVGQIDGVDCKARYDAIIPAAATKRPDAGDVVLDFKSSEDCTFEGMRQGMKSYKMSARAAFYVDLAEAITGEPHRFMWVFVQTKEPFFAAGVLAGDGELPYGRDQYRRILAEYKVCLETGVYPPPVTGILDGLFYPMEALA